MSDSPLYARLQKASEDKPVKSQKAEVLSSFAKKLTPEMITVIANAMEMGMPDKSVAGLIGVHKTTFLRWLGEGAKEDCPDPRKVELAVRVEQARQRAVMAGVQNLAIHAQRDWRAQVELLRAMDPETWSPTQRIQHEVTQVEKEEDLSMLTDEELEIRAQIEAKIATKKRGG